MPWFKISTNVSAFLVCQAGYFKNGDLCSSCPENTIKMLPGNATTCNMTCDATTTIPNDEHTACGELFSFWIIQECTVQNREKRTYLHYECEGLLNTIK